MSEQEDAEPGCVETTEKRHRRTKVERAVDLIAGMTWLETQALGSALVDKSPAMADVLRAEIAARRLMEKA